MVTSFSTATLTGPTGAPHLATPLRVLGAYNGRGGSGLIDLINTRGTGCNLSGGVLTVTDGATPMASLDSAGGCTTKSFTLTTDMHGGTLIQTT